MASEPIQLVVGLGNPGERYQGTRHNVGFMVADRLALDSGCSFRAHAPFHGFIAECGNSQGRIRLLKPETYMNRSGQAVRATLDWFGLRLESLLVIVDDMDLPLGRLRLRREGGAGGHNGLKSLIEHLGSQRFLRLRIGIGAPATCPTVRHRRTVGHVLGRFNSSESSLVEEVLREASRAPELLNRSGVDRAGTRLNSFRPSALSPNPVTPS